MRPPFLSLGARFLPPTLPLLHVTLNTSWKPTPLELKAETTGLRLKAAAGWAQGPALLARAPRGPAGGLPRSPAALFTRDDEKGAFPQSQGSQSGIDLNLWGFGGERQSERGEHLHVSKRRHEGHGEGEEGGVKRRGTPK